MVTQALIAFAENRVQYHDCYGRGLICQSGARFEFILFFLQQTEHYRYRHAAIEVGCYFYFSEI